MQGQSSRGEYRVGPGASSLLLIFVAVCLTTIGILMLISSIADSRLSDRSTQHVQGYYEAATRVQREIGVLDGQLFSARKQAGEDLNTYRELVLDLTGDQIPMSVSEMDNDEDALRITFFVPMSENNRIECDLRVPMSFEGARYEIARHVAANISDWVPEENMELFGSVSGGGLFDVTEDSEDEEESSGGLFDDEETSGGIFDTEGDAEEESGIVGEGQSVQTPDDGEGE